MSIPFGETNENVPNPDVASDTLLSTDIPVEAAIGALEETLLEKVLESEPVTSDALQVQDLSQSALDLEAEEKNVTVGPRTWNIYVGELPANVTEEQIKAKFAACGEIRGVNVIRDKTTGLCRGYAFVHFGTPEAYRLALSPEFSNLAIAGQQTRVKPSDNKQTLFIGNVPMDMSSSELKAALLDLCKGIADGIQVELKSSNSVGNLSRGFCFVTFNSYETAEAAKKVLMNAVVRDRQLNVSWAESSNRSAAEDDPNSKVTTLYVSNIGPNVQEETLLPLFSQFGEVTKCVVVKTPSGENRGYGFVTFKDRETCLQATKQLHNVELDNQRIGVTFAKTSSSSGGSSTSSNLKMRGTRSNTQMSDSRGMRHSASSAHRGTHHIGGSGSGNNAIAQHSLNYNTPIQNWTAPYGPNLAAPQVYYGAGGHGQPHQAAFGAGSGSSSMHGAGRSERSAPRANSQGGPSHPTQHHVPAPKSYGSGGNVPPVTYPTYNGYPTPIGWYPSGDPSVVSQYPTQNTSTANSNSSYPPYSYDPSYYYYSGYNQVPTGVPGIQTPAPLGGTRYPY